MTRYLPDIPTLTPSSYDDYTRCPRLFFLGALLRVPASDHAPTSTQGQLVHDMLWRVHESGSCHDVDHVRDVLAGHGVDTDVMRDYVARHARRCPSIAATGEAHEHWLARFHRVPPPMFMAVARVDAIWVHDGWLDARDYKTGSRWHERVSDVPAARVQVFLLAPKARERGLHLRLRYEYLSPEVDDDPDPWEPDDDDLDAIEEELREAVADMRGDQEWAGVAEPDVCGRCRYRTVCRDSVAPGEPAWPVLSVG